MLISWGTQVSSIPTAAIWDASAPQANWKGQKSLFDDFQEPTLAHFEAQAACTWGDLSFSDEDSVKKFDFEDHAKSLKKEVALTYFVNQILPRKL